MTTDNTNTTRNDSLAARTDTWLQSLLGWSPGQLDIIKTVTMQTAFCIWTSRGCFWAGVGPFRCLPWCGG